MYNKTVTSDKRGRKKSLKCVSKSKTSVAEFDSVKLHNKLRNKSKTKYGEYRTPSSSEKSKMSHGITNYKKLDMYKTMKKMLERKYKQKISKNDSDEKLYPERKQYDSMVHSVTPEINKQPFSEKTPEKISSVSEVEPGSVGQNKTEVKSNELLSNEKLVKKPEIKSRLLDTSNSSKLKKIKVTKQRIKKPLEESSVPKKKLNRRFPTMESSQLLKNNKMNQNNKTNQNNKSSKHGAEEGITPRSNLVTGNRLPSVTVSMVRIQYECRVGTAEKTRTLQISEKQAKYKISKRLANLAQHKEIPSQVKKDLNFNPFIVQRRSLIFQDKPCKLKPGSNENRSKTLKEGHEKKLIKISEPIKKKIGRNRKRRRLIKTSKYPYTTPRILELSKPVVKNPPMSFLTPDEVFTVKKRALKAKCSKRISELAYPVLRPEDLKIQVDSPPFSIKRRALRARCTRRVRELAKPLPRRCRSAVRKKEEERAEG